MSENNTVVEIHGCIVCARIYNILVLYSPDGRLEDRTATSPGGHCVTDEGQPLVACDTHTAGEIDTVYNNGRPGRSKRKTENRKTNETVINGL